MWVVDYDANVGDSGAPYFLSNTAYGIHSDSSGGWHPGSGYYSWYSTADNIESATTWDICLSAGC